MEDKGKSSYRVSGICEFPENTIFGRKSWTSRILEYLFDSVNSREKNIATSDYGLKHKSQQNGENMESRDNENPNSNNGCGGDEFRTENA